MIMSLVQPQLGATHGADTGGRAATRGILLIGDQFEPVITFTFKVKFSLNV